MLILVIDVAAEHSGAVTILEQFIEEFKNDHDNQYIIALSSIEYNDVSNIQFMNYKWVKKSPFHRLLFDKVYCKRIVKQYKPDKIISLQNGAVAVSSVKQEVYFQNALPISDYRFTLKQSKSLWVYQNLIGRMWKCSLKRASKIYVQAKWVKDALVSKWKIKPTIIYVKYPQIDLKTNIRPAEVDKMQLFYPANGSIYKNHIVILRAMKILKERKELGEIKLYLTGDIHSLSVECRDIINRNNLPVVFVGRLEKDQMIEYYLNSVLLFPSLIETVGLPLLEAKSLNRPIVAASMPYAYEALNGYKNCLYFDPKEEKSLLSALSEMIKESNSEKYNAN